MGEIIKGITHWFLFFFSAPGSTGNSHRTASTICWACGSASLRLCPMLKPLSLTCSKRIRQKSQKLTSRPGWSLCTSYWGKESREMATLRCQHQSLTRRAPVWISAEFAFKNGRYCGKFCESPKDLGQPTGLFCSASICVGWIPPPVSLYLMKTNGLEKIVCLLRKTDQLIPFLGVSHCKGGTAGLASSGVLRLSVEVSVFRKKGD